VIVIRLLIGRQFDISDTTLCDGFPFFGVRLFRGTSLSLRLACTYASSSLARHFCTKHVASASL